MSGSDPDVQRMLRVEVPLALETSRAFGLLVEELSVALEGVGVTFKPRGQGYVYLRALGIEPPPFYER